MRNKKGEFTIVWSWKDIQWLAESGGVNLTKKEAIEIFEEIKRGVRDVMVAHGNEAIEQCMYESDAFNKKQEVEV
ncbi:MAG: hypothetical protein EB023_11000 [Flavobacteriia bacterium]|nr:hypothetical protein [Flavobacteriia bacterium]